MYEIKEYLRCKITGNPCGTDTWEIDTPCKCKACQKWLARSHRYLMDLLDRQDLIDYDIYPTPPPPPYNLKHKLTCLKEEEFNKVITYIDALEIFTDMLVAEDGRENIHTKWGEVWDLRPKIVKKRIPE